MAPIMREISQSPDVRLQVVATNMHLSDDYGHTVDEIMADGFNVDVRVESLVPGGTPGATVLSMAKVQEGLAKAFETLRPDLVVILGDRYEALAAAAAAVVFNIPVAHLHGGETTEGAIDDRFRHAITKLSTYHFAATPQYVEKIISMGENPSHVFHSGAPGASVSQDDYPSEYLYQPPFILLAFHPVTTLSDKGEAELKATIEALDSFINQGYQILVTMPNSDPGTLRISQMLLDWEKERNGMVRTVKSLGAKRFHQAMENAVAMVGNSSAALIEAPSHRLAAVNVGIRQKGRAHGITVIDAPADKDKIIMALGAILSFEMKAVLLGQPVSALNPYFKENSSSFIAKKLIELL